MLAPFMVHAWVVATIVAVIAGVVGFFVVVRGAAFAAHAIPNGAFAGAAAASFIGVSVLWGLGVFSVLAAIAIALLGRRGRHDAVTALALVLLLALGALFLSQTTEYEPEIFALLFGEVLGVSSNEILPVALLGLACVAAVCILYRPLLLASVAPEVAAGRGVRLAPLEMAFLIVLALATALTVPVVGALLIFSLMIGPPAAARCVVVRPPAAIALGVLLALVTVWAAIALAYLTNWPVGFYVGVGSAAVYGLGRGWAALRRRAPTARPTPLAAAAVTG